MSTNVEVKYPEVEVELTGKDGNAFFVLGSIQKALKSAGVPKGEIDAFFNEATRGDYDALMQTVMRWVTVR